MTDYGFGAKFSARQPFQTGSAPPISWIPYSDDVNIDAGPRGHYGSLGSHQNEWNVPHVDVHAGSHHGSNWAFQERAFTQQASAEENYDIGLDELLRRIGVDEQEERSPAADSGINCPLSPPMSRYLSIFVFSNDLVFSK